MFMTELELLKQDGQAPMWMTEESYGTMSAGYLLPGETPNQLYFRIARAAAGYYEKQMGTSFATELQDALYHALTNAYLSPSTPVAANFGCPPDAGRGLPVSCFGLKPKNSIDGIFNTAHEAAMLSKNGGGLGISLSDLDGISPVTHWARLYDVTADIVSQGNTRRGSVALYLDAGHKDIMAFLDAHDTTRGDQRQKLKCNIAIGISNEFMENLKAKSQWEVEVFTRILELRMRTGSPYIQFTDTINANRPIDYEKLGLFVSASQLCSEIMLYSDWLHTYTCVLASVNLATWPEWSQLRYRIGEFSISVFQLGILLLDAVCEEFILLSEDIAGMSNSRRFAIKSRALGLGALGLHTLYQKLNMPFNSQDAKSLNERVFKTMKSETTAMSKLLGQLLGVPEWCQASGQRNTHLMAIAPTLGNSVLCSAGSGGIEPIQSNYYVFDGAKGSWTRKNAVLEQILSKLGLNTTEVWQSIMEHDGSVQHILEMPEQYRNVFKTAREIDQLAIIEQAAARQKYIDQGQSLNLFISHDESPVNIWRYHIEAWKQGLFTLYYVRSNSPLSKFRSTTLQGDKDVRAKTWLIVGRETCTYCRMAKTLLMQYGIEYEYREKSNGPVPEIYADGELVGGFEDLKRELGVSNNVVNDVCEACDG